MVFLLVIAAVVHKLAINRLHQLFVVDENGCLLSQITLRDIIKRMVDQSMWAIAEEDEAEAEAKE